MSLRNSIKKRFERWMEETQSRFPRFAGFVLIVIFVVSMAREVRLSEVAALSTKYASLINLALTVALVGITAFYAWVTHHMARELIDSHRASIRPLLVFDIAPLVVKYPDKPEVSQISMGLVIWNAGRGHAIQTEVSGTVLPTERSGMVSDISPVVPSLFAPGERHECDWTFPLRINFDEDRENFFEVDATYEDTEGNIYQLLASYSLRGSENFKFLKSMEETLFFLPFHQRKEFRSPYIINDSSLRVRLYRRKW